MLDEALREFRRVAELRPADAGAPFFLGLIAAAAGALGGGGRRLPPGDRDGRPRAAALHNLGFALERMGRLDEAEAAYGDAAGRARDDARVMLGWGIVALQARRVPGGAGPAGARARAAAAASRCRRSGTGPPPWRAPAWMMRRRGARGRGGRRGLPGSAVLQNNLAVLLELQRRRRRRRGDAARRARRGPRHFPRSPRTWPTSSTGTAATTRRARPTSGRPSSPPSWATTSTSSWATSPTSGATTTRARESWASRDRAQSRARARPGQPRDAGPRAVTPPTIAASPPWPARSPGAPGSPLEAYKDKCVRRRIAVRMRACGVHTYADYQALLDRSPAEYERLRDALTINVTRFYRNAETWNLLRRDLFPSSARPEPRRGPGLERRLLVGRGGLYLAMLCGRAPRARRPLASELAASRSMPPTSIASAWSGPRRRRTGARPCSRCRPSSSGAYFEPAGPELEVVRPGPRARPGAHRSTSARGRRSRRDYHLIVCRNV